MKIFTKAADLQAFALAAKRSNKKIGLVPTMGFLHSGHASLMNVAHNEGVDELIVSIFVNPTQFGPNEDLDKYPRSFEKDCELCQAHKVTAIFAPEPAAMYAPDHSVWVSEEKLSKGLCGKSRPIHFRGVATVVSKLFNLTLPDVAVFGQKDAQQALIIRRMIRDLNFPIKMIIAPLIRDTDNLAMSSRNRYLSAEERKRALSINRALFKAREDLEQSGVEIIDTVKSEIVKTISEAGGKIDYVEILSADTLEAVQADTREILIAAAVYFGTTRLIDNVLVNIKH